VRCVILGIKCATQGTEFVILGCHGYCECGTCDLGIKCATQSTKCVKFGRECGIMDMRCDILGTKCVIFGHDM
jgi:hypothetical protein